MSHVSVSLFVYSEKVGYFDSRSPGNREFILYLKKQNVAKSCLGTQSLRSYLHVHMLCSPTLWECYACNSMLRWLKYDVKKQ